METLMSAFKRDFNPNKVKIKNKKSLQNLVDSYVDVYNRLLAQEHLNWRTPQKYNELYS